MTSIRREFGDELTNNVISHNLKNVVNKNQVSKPTKMENTQTLPEECHSSIVTNLVVSDTVVPDPEQHDCDTGFMATEYVKDIYHYLLNDIEPRQLLPSQFIHPGSEIRPRMRITLMDWLVKVHQRYNLLPETWYLTVYLMDRYLHQKPVKKRQYQCLGVAAMFLASKFEEIYAPEVTDFVHITDNSFTASEIRALERDILHNARFVMTVTYPIIFLRRYSKIGGATEIVHHTAKYLCEICQFNYEMAHCPPSAIAAASFVLAMSLHESDKMDTDWRNVMETYGGYSMSDLKTLISQLLCYVRQLIQNPANRFRAVNDKYYGPNCNDRSINSFLDSKLDKFLIDC